MQPEDLFALRSYIQRGETRLSAMHTAAGAYIGGAGLLLLLPAIFQYQVPQLLSFIVDYLRALPATWPEVLLGAWVIPVATALFIPLYSLKLLLQELVVLYFVPHVETARHFLPRFTLTPLSMPLDDPSLSEQGTASSIKRSVTDEVYRHEVHIAVAPNQNSQDARSLRRTQLRYPNLARSLAERCDIRNRTTSEEGAEFYNVRAAKAGLVDRTLFSEAAHLEASLLRFSAHLRVMAFRYFKSLLSLIWTFIFLVLMSWGLGYVKDNPLTDRIFEIVAITGGVVWSGSTPFVVNLPLRWIRAFSSLDTSASHGDLDLSRFEGIVLVCCVFSFSIAAAGFAYLALTYWIDNSYLFAILVVAVTLSGINLLLSVKTYLAGRFA
jgi:hypothetical protein